MNRLAFGFYARRVSPVLFLAAFAGSALADPAPLVSGDNIPPEVAALIAEIQAKPVYDHATWGIRLVDPATG